MFICCKVITPISTIRRFFREVEADVDLRDTHAHSGERGKGLVDEIADVLAERRPLYEAAAHHTVDASRPLQSICRHIADLWNAQAL